MGHLAQQQVTGWSAGLEQQIAALGDTLPVKIHKITNAYSFEPVAPCRGRFAVISIRAENLLAVADLNHPRVTIGNSLGTITADLQRNSSSHSRRCHMFQFNATAGSPVIRTSDASRDPSRSFYPAHLAAPQP